MAVDAFARSAPMDGGARDENPNAINWHRGDLNDAAAVAPVFEGVDIVYDASGMSSPARSWKDPVAAFDGLRRTTALMPAAAKAGVRKWVMLSSGGAVYGNRTGLLKETLVSEPICPYGIAKAAAERVAHYVRRETAMGVDIFRASNVYGPGQERSMHGVLRVWIPAVLAGEEIRVFGDGSIVRDFLFVDDLMEILCRSAEDLNRCGLWNVGSGQGTSLTELVDLVCKQAHCTVPVTYHPAQPSDPHSVVLDISKLRSDFSGFEPTPLAEGIARTLARYTITPVATV